MIEKLKPQTIEKDGGAFGIIVERKVATDEEMQEKINEVIDAVNELHEEAENNARIRADLANLIDTLVAENNIHEKQIDELQMKVEPEKCKTPVDPYAEQRKWVGKLCHFWNKTEYTDDIYGFLTDIVSTNKYKPEDNYFVPFKDEFGSFYEHCEPVKPDDDIIYKGEQ